MSGHEQHLAHTELIVTATCSVQMAVADLKSKTFLRNINHDMYHSTVIELLKNNRRILHVTAHYNKQNC